MDIANLNSEDVLIESGLSEYKTGMDFFYSELVELNVILYLAEQIVNFPFELFTHPDNTIFFSTVMRSFHDSAVLIVTRLATDQKGDLYPLPRFKNRVGELVKPEYKDSFFARLREVRFDQAINALLRRTKELRGNRIAHTTQESISGSIAISRPTLSELKELRDALNSLLDALSFNVEHMMLPVPYDPNVIHPKGSNHKTDIEEILEAIAKKSRILNMAERDPEKWRYRREKMSEDKINKLNRYRRKLGMPEV